MPLWWRLWLYGGLFAAVLQACRMNSSDVLLDLGHGDGFLTVIMSALTGAPRVAATPGARLARRGC